MPPDTIEDFPTPPGGLRPPNWRALLDEAISAEKLRSEDLDRQRGTVGARRAVEQSHLYVRPLADGVVLGRARRIEQRGTGAGL